MERKMKIIDFAELVGGSAKSIYERLKKNGDLPENEKLVTVKEKFKGRDITLIVTNENQIKLYQSIYGNSPIMNSNYEDSVTLNYGNQQVNESEFVEKNTNNNTLSPEILDKLLTLNEDFNNRLERVNNELITAKSQLLFLEDKKNVAEGDKKHWQDEYFKLDKENKDLNKRLANANKGLLVLITLSITFIVTFITVNALNVKNIEPATVSPVNNVQSPTVQTKPIQKVPQRASNGNHRR